MQNGRILSLPQAAPTPEEIDFLAGPKCGDCLHWKRLPRQQMAVNPAMKEHLSPEAFAKAVEQANLHNRGVDLSIPAQGECRERLHSVPQMTQQNGQQVFAGALAYFPSPIPAEFRACGQFAERIQARR